MFNHLIFRPEKLAPANRRNQEKGKKPKNKPKEKRKKRCINMAEVKIKIQTQRKERHKKQTQNPKDIHERKKRMSQSLIKGKITFNVVWLKM